MIFRQYFALHLTRLKRQSVEYGLNPVISFVTLLLGFYGLTFYLFSKTFYAKYLYIIIAISILSPFAEITRNEFLKFTYQKKDYYQLRIYENLITVFPFILFLLYKLEFYSVVMLMLLSIGTAFFTAIKITTAPMPTPFYKKPFEFIVGFRKALPVFLFAYLIVAISIIYQNFYLGIFSLLLAFLLCFSFYNEPENVFYVWVYKRKATGFLLDKIKTAIYFSTIISLPITIPLLIFFHVNMVTVLIVQLLCYCYLATFILAKYSAFPKKINLPQIILLGLSIPMPPLLLALAPFFYLQSKKQLKEILG